MIYQEIKKYTKNVQRHSTKKPDIVFTNKKGEEIAIEIETGIDVKYKNKKRYHDDKFEQCKKEYGNRCYIFLVTRAMRNSYKRHGLPLLFRSQINRFVRLHFKGLHNSIIVEKLSSAD